MYGDRRSRDHDQARGRSIEFGQSRWVQGHGSECGGLGEKRREKKKRRDIIARGKAGKTSDRGR